MCFHFSLAAKKKVIEKSFGATFDGRRKYKPIFHATAFAAREHPVILNEDPGKIEMLHWGLIPHWVKDEKTAQKLRFMTANAKSETLYEKPSFRDSVKKKRCLVLVDGFYEWQHVKDKKYPYFIHQKGNKPFALAGLWSEWLNKKTGELVQTFSVITTTANPLLAKIHNAKKRMPVILEKGDYKTWLDEGSEAKELMKLMKPYKGHLEAHTISKLITARDRDTNVVAVMKKFVYKELV